MKSMKRVLSAALALSLTAGMALTGSAMTWGNFTTTVEDAGGNTLDSTVELEPGDTITVTIDADSFDDNDSTPADIKISIPSSLPLSGPSTVSPSWDSNNSEWETIDFDLVVTKAVENGNDYSDDISVSLDGVSNSSKDIAIEFKGKVDPATALDDEAVDDQDTGTLGVAGEHKIDITYIFNGTIANEAAAEAIVAISSITFNNESTADVDLEDIFDLSYEVSGGKVYLVLTVKSNLTDDGDFEGTLTLTNTETVVIKVEGTLDLTGTGTGSVDVKTPDTTLDTTLSDKNKKLELSTDDDELVINITDAFTGVDDNTDPDDVKALLDMPNITITGTLTEADGTVHQLSTGFDVSRAYISISSVFLVIPLDNQFNEIPAGVINGEVKIPIAASAGGGNLTVGIAGRVAPPSVSSRPAASGKITDFKSGNILADSRVVVAVSGMGEKAQNGDNKSVTDLNNLDIRPDSEIQIYLSSFMFVWDGANKALNEGGDLKVSTSQLRNGKITVRKSVSKGSNVLDTVELASDSKAGAHINIEFVEWFVSVKEQDVDFTVYLAKSGTRNRDAEVDIAGTMENDEEEADEDDDYVSSEDGTVIEAQAYIRNIEMYAGNGVSAHLNMFKDRKYYLVALNEADASDDTIMNQYPEIDNVIKMLSVNVKSSGTKVSFDMDDSFYVYGSDGTYLGTSGEKVDFSDKYYFATSRISITGADVDTDDDDDDDDDDYVIPGGDGTANPDGGGDSNNANDNPGTGANGFVNVAVLAGLLSLGAVGMTARKRK